MASTPKKRGRRADPRRLGVADAKSRFAEVVRNADHGVTVIHRRGHDVAVVLSVDDYRELLRRAETSVHGGAGGRLVGALAEWRAEHGGIDFAPEAVRIVPQGFPAKAR